MHDKAKGQIVQYFEGLGTQTDYPVEHIIGLDIAHAARLVYKVLAGIEPSHLDRIFIIGFSRGAVIARYVSRMINDPDFRLELNDGVHLGNAVRPGVEFVGAFDPVSGPLWNRPRKRRERDTISQVMHDRGLAEYFEIVAINEKSLALESKSHFSLAPRMEEIRPVNKMLGMGASLIVPNNAPLTGVAMGRELYPIDAIRAALWFPGAHGDIGGGNMTFSLNNHALFSMLDRILGRNLPTEIIIDGNAVKKACQQIRNSSIDAIGRGVSWWSMPWIARKRKPRKNDFGALLHDVADQIIGKEIVNLTNFLSLLEKYSIPENLIGADRFSSSYQNLRASLLGAAGEFHI